MVFSIFFPNFHRTFCTLIVKTQNILYTNSENPDQMMHSAAFGLGRYSLPIPNKRPSMAYMG